MLRTTDGGATWAPQDSRTAQWFTAVQFVGPEEGWAVGAAGTILRYARSTH
ncbi:MAG: hypothetical protein E8D45_05355 [Nitrospira sp.]|nr:MAG: hypothetical protein E8D45_05355 [Nitrospira sp.]